jgi:crossover junction endodeoxyribonuclease RuvC
MRCLGLDPGLGRCGWALVEDEVAQDYGTWTTSPHLPEPQRLAMLYQAMTDTLLHHQPDCVILESLFFGANHTTAMQVSQARGVLVLACGVHAIPCYAVTPHQVKQAVTGYGRASKAQVRQMVTQIWHLPKPPTPDDTADALAVAWTGQPIARRHQRLITHSS